MAVPKIKLEGVTKSFGSNHVLKGVDLEVADGESLVLIGGSASGKTLLLKLILGLEKPDSGSIQIDGVETTKLDRKAQEKLLHRMGMLFQQSALFDSMTIWENVAFQLLQDHQLSQEESRRIAIEKIVSVGLTADVGDLLPAEISGGMQKRVGFARAIANDPEIVLLDEPTAGLDPIMTNVIGELILKGVRELGATTLSITSDMKGARQVADRVAMIYDGKIIWCGPTEDVDNSDNPYLDQFIHNRAEGPIKMAITAA
ncbi:MAG: ATP-binding cassette domain-containing protein [Rhodospirillaceae bacterium]|jgi:phospholipid/cholesterol/gamma-HCH transport system ATP-binding protein|nr:ATP-binding cassette domain-containing protein [Rhodospirillaceae bacterium]MBT4587925.1 ATP-binding cassette domain-containing protein [Rhodospirillaceae bacterium]MBT4941166.1 ATP-binding cassette domain-containing protein [Rhodospirillaceae bacterium]MBT7265899.1 ATP-binding cassette domain-containing protein [Rhodospirillaceae bacterium]